MPLLWWACIKKYTIGLTEGELISSMCYPPRARKTLKRYSSIFDRGKMEIIEVLIWIVYGQLVSLVFLECGIHKRHTSQLGHQLSLENYLSSVNIVVPILRSSKAPCGSIPWFRESVILLFIESCCQNLPLVLSIVQGNKSHPTSVYLSSLSRPTRFDHI